MVRGIDESQEEIMKDLSNKFTEKTRVKVKMNTLNPKGSVNYKNKNNAGLTRTISEKEVKEVVWECKGSKNLKT